MINVQPCYVPKVGYVIAFFVSSFVQNFFFWCEDVASFEGANCRSLTSPGLKGYIPHLNPSITLTGVRERGHASATSAAMISEVITRPECLVRYLW